MRTPHLDRDAARHEVTEIDRWEREVRAAYTELRPQALFSPGTAAGSEQAGLADFEREVRDDREWAEGYRCGLADARRKLSERRGPGVMGDDPKDGWSPSVTRQAGYADGLEDGS